jgi:hypothetical protein
LSRCYATSDLSVSLEVANIAIRRPVFVATKRLRSPAAFTYASFLLICMAAAPARAQQQTPLLARTTTSLPDAPLPQAAVADDAGQTASTEGSATVSGVVLDTTGAAIPGALVILTHRDGTQVRSIVSGGTGEFTFANLPAGSYLVRIDAIGFAAFHSGEFDVAAQQTYEVPNLSLSVSSADTITVRPTEEIAAEQIKAEEKQRLFGIVPNFYVSYAKDPAPLTSRQKLSLATHDTLDWTSWIGISATAGIEQAQNTYAGYGQGAAGYGKRWAAQFGDGRSSDYLSHYVFASLFHEDPRYFYQGTGTFKSRLYHAISNAWIARGDNGKDTTNYAYILGAVGSGALSNAYYPHADRGFNLVYDNALLSAAGLVGGNIFQEFFGKRLTKNASKSANAQP